MEAKISVGEIDPNFEPQTRARSNTWPCRPVEDFVEHSSPSSDDHVNDHTKDILGIKQKPSSRRNAWGNLSYADLITKAIQSSPEQRLTLSQIYDWMVQNVPYFKDKGDNTSSAGWKNSIRHNLSLHSRFMRIQNEGTGKSSWWVINPDAKPGKAPRRRAGSMETKSLEKKRGRIKKRIEAIRAAQENGTLSGEDLQDLHYSFNLSPEFRTRAGSNASSCGRLSPIQAAVEPDLHDGQVPPMSPIPWASEVDADNFSTNSNESYSLVDSLVGGLNIQEGSQGLSCDTDMELTLKHQLLSGGSMMQYNSQNNYDSQRFSPLPAPPSYNDHLQQQQKSSQHSPVLNMDSLSGQNRKYGSVSPNHMYQDNHMTPQHQIYPPHTMTSPGQSALGIVTQLSPARSPQMSPSNYSPQSQSCYMHSPTPIKPSPIPSPVSHPMNQAQPQLQMGGVGSRPSLLQQCLEAPNDSMLRAALTQHMHTTFQPQVQQTQQQQQQQQQQQDYRQHNVTYSTVSMPIINSIINNNQINSLPSAQTTNYYQNAQMSQMVSGPPVRNESNMSLEEQIDTNSMLDLDYDVEQLLRHELAMDSNLEFNFDNSSSQNGPTSEGHNLVR